MVQSGIESQTHRKRNTTRARSEKRQKTALLGIRLLPEEKRILEAEANRRGLRSIQELVRLELQPLLTSRLDTDRFVKPDALWMGWRVTPSAAQW